MLLARQVRVLHHHSHALHFSIPCLLCNIALPAVFDMIEYIMAKYNITARLHLPPWAYRFIYRGLYVVLTAFIAILLPFFGGEHSSMLHMSPLQLGQACWQLTAGGGHMPVP